MTVAGDHGTLHAAPTQPHLQRLRRWISGLVKIQRGQAGQAFMEIYSNAKAGGEHASGRDREGEYHP